MPCCAALNLNVLRIAELASVVQLAIRLRQLSEPRLRYQQAVQSWARKCTALHKRLSMAVHGTLRTIHSSRIYRARSCTRQTWSWRIHLSAPVHLTKEGELRRRCTSSKQPALANAAMSSGLASCRLLSPSGCHRRCRSTTGTGCCKCSAVTPPRCPFCEPNELFE
jgi:hypothetical protein